MKLKIFDIVVPIAIIRIFIDGFQGEFANPTLVDFMKWGSCTLMVIAYIVYKIKGVKHE